MNEVVLHYDTACRAIAEASSIDEVKDVLDKAVALRIYARMANNKKLEADAAIVRLRAERRVGEMIAAQKESVGLNDGGRPPKTGVTKTPVKPTLKEAGVDKNLAKKARQLAALSSDEFDDVVAETRRGVNRASKIATNNRTKARRRTDKLETLAAKAMAIPDKAFVVVVMDPAWRQEPWSRETGLNKAPDNHYPTQTPAEIAALKPRLYRDAVVYMFTTTGMMRIAQTILEDWGLEYHSNTVWIKERRGKQMGTGRWSRVDHEIVLIYTQGNPPAPLGSDLVSSVLYGPVEEHSVKPDEFFDAVLRAYPAPIPKLEMYGRKKRVGFTVLGNEIEENEDD